MDPYVYKPLNPREIRLLRLHPGQPDQQLTGSIVHVPLMNPTYHPKKDNTGAHLEHPISYDAISYHWGSDPNTPFQLIVDENSVIGLTVHLHSVLQRVVQPDKEQVIWVDAICINQVDNNSDEKAQQIRLMPDIYRIAKRVHVHLGPEADNSWLAIEFLENIAKYGEYLDDTLNELSANAYELAREKGFVLPGPNDESWKALRAFWQRPWFRRVWVIQEFVYAADIVVLCGDQEVDWRKLWLAARVYIGNHRLTFSAAESMDVTREAHEGAQAFFTIADLRIRAWGYMSIPYLLLSMSHTDDVPTVELTRKKIRVGDQIPIRRDFDAIVDFEKLSKDNLLRNRASGEAFSFGRPDLLLLFHLTTNFLATEPVDRIYALLGLAKEVDHPDFAITYSQTPEVVCQRFAAALINRGHCSVVLGMAGVIAQSCKVRANLPSWVPNWTGTIRPDDKMVSMCVLIHDLQEKSGDSKEHGSEEKDDKDKDVEAAGKKEEPMYRAALDSSAEFRFGDDDGTLILKGFRADAVADVLPGRLTAPPDIYESIIGVVIKGYPTGESVEEAIWRTLIANRALDGLEAPEAYGLQYKILKLYVRNVITKVALLAAVSVPFIIFLLRVVPMSIQVIIVTVLFIAGSITAPVATVGVIMILRSASKLMLIPVLGIMAWRAWHVMLDKYSDQVVEFLGGLGVGSVFGATPDASGPPECAGYCRSLSLTTYRYNLGITTAGYLWLLPLSAKAGDEIVIFHGCYTPFVLRRTGIKGHYHLVGECYVHGIMHGELFGDPKFTIEDIYLH